MSIISINPGFYGFHFMAGDLNRKIHSKKLNTKKIVKLKIIVCRRCFTLHFFYRSNNMYKMCEQSIDCYNARAVLADASVLLSQLAQTALSKSTYKSLVLLRVARICFSAWKCYVVGAITCDNVCFVRFIVGFKSFRK